jgi:hypothetical protein
MAEQNNVFQNSFVRPVIRIGTITMVVAWAGNFLPCLYLYLRYGVVPPWGSILKIWVLVASVYGAFYIVEPISYYAILGLSGTYMSFLAGNIANLRLPCSAMAQEATGVEPGSQEAEVISALGIAGSVIVNTIGVTLAAILGAALLTVFPPFVKKAFAYILPAVFGAVFVQFAIRYPVVGLMAIPIPLILLGWVKVLPIWVVIPACVFGTVALARLYYQAHLKRREAR